MIALDHAPHLSAEEVAAAVEAGAPAGTIEGPARALLVTHMPLLTEARPLFPHPASTPGAHLYRASGLTMGEYLGWFVRVSLLPEHSLTWDREAGLERAAGILGSVAGRGLRLVAVGQPAAHTFGLDDPFRVRRLMGVEVIGVPCPPVRGAATKQIRRALHWAARTSKGATQ